MAGAVVAAVVTGLGAAPASALTVPSAPPAGCIATAPATNNGTTGDYGCSYTASGPGSYAAIAPANNWTITINGINGSVVVLHGGPAHQNTPSNGTLATVAGDEVVVSIDPTEDPTQQVYGGSAAIAVGDQSSSTPATPAG